MLGSTLAFWMLKLGAYCPKHAECGWPAGHYAASRKALEKNEFPLLRPGAGGGAAQPPEGYVATQPSGAPAASLWVNGRMCIWCLWMLRLCWRTTASKALLAQVSKQRYSSACVRLGQNKPLQAA